MEVRWLPASKIIQIDSARVRAAPGHSQGYCPTPSDLPDFSKKCPKKALGIIVISLILKEENWAVLEYYWGIWKDLNSGNKFSTDTDSPLHVASLIKQQRVRNRSHFIIST